MAMRNNHNVICEHIGFVEKVGSENHAPPGALFKNDVPDSATREWILFSLANGP
jgi:hypothetical protein